jgi:hypothetical protein
LPVISADSSSIAVRIRRAFMHAGVPLHVHSRCSDDCEHPGEKGRSCSVLGAL